MPWSTPTAADVECHLNAGELVDYRQHAAQIDDPLPTIIADVVAHVRGYIGARHALSEPGVPDSLRLTAIQLIIHALAGRVRKAGEGDDDRRAAAEAAQRTLTAVAEGTFSLGEATTELFTPASGGWGSQTKFISP